MREIEGEGFTFEIDIDPEREGISSYGLEIKKKIAVSSTPKIYNFAIDIAEQP